jgi:hypothetical protein
MPNTERYAKRRGRITSVGPDIANLVTRGGVTTTALASVDITGFTHSTTPPDPAGVVGWEIQVRNETGADRRVWLGGRFSQDTGGGEYDIWSAGKFVAATTTYTDETTDAKDLGADDFTIQTTTNQDGFLVGGGQQSTYTGGTPLARQFNCFVLTVSTPYNNGGTALGATIAQHLFQYWNGSSWSNLTLLTPHPDLGLAVGQITVIWQIPDDWAVYADGDVNGTDDRLIGQYVIRYMNTDAPSVGGAAAGANAARLFVGWARKSFLLVPSGGSDVSDAAPVPLCSRDELVWMVMDGAGAGMECWVVGEESDDVGIIGDGR